MTEYRRFYIPKALWFFTVNLAKRKGNRLLIEQINELSQAFRYVKNPKTVLHERRGDYAGSFTFDCMDAGGRAMQGAIAEHLDIAARRW